MKYVLTKSNVLSHNISIISICDSYHNSLTSLHEYIENNYEKNSIITYIKDNNRIFQYKKNIGYLYNDKQLENVFQICLYTD